MADSRGLARSLQELRATQGCIAGARACLREAQWHLADSRAWLDALELAPSPPPACPGRRERVDIIAEAFEVTPRDVVSDAAAVKFGTASHVPIQRWLQHRHGWDSSIAPFYVARLSRLLQQQQR